MSELGLRDRGRGLLVGLAVADAIGAPVEFELPARIAGRRDELFAMPGGGGFNWAPGEFTDDTQMALVLARHLRDVGAVDPDRLAPAFAEWAKDAADVGIQTRRVLGAVTSGADWREAAAALPPTAEGNGSLMRVAPVALVATNREQVARLAREQSRVTHPAAACLDACAVYATLLWDVIDGGWPSFAEVAARATNDSVHNAILEADAAGPPQMSGWVLHTLTGALWAVYGADGYADAVWRAVSLGVDADTVGAVAGALAGARWGLAGVPSDLASRVTSKHPLFAGEYPQTLIQLAEALIDGSRRGSRGEA